ncbi:LPXTG cell wall anchor domain-containing protein [Streptococcus phocae subsp. phocae]
MALGVQPIPMTNSNGQLTGYVAGKTQEALTQNSNHLQANSKGENLPTTGETASILGYMGMIVISSLGIFFKKKSNG